MSSAPIDQTVDRTTKLCPPAHLLSLPQEVREKVYGYILETIHNAPRGLECTPTSEYDGLPFTCRQLYEETKESVFCFRYMSQQVDRFVDYSLDRTNFMNVRSITFQIDFGATKSETYRDMTLFLENIQLSLQELHLIFVGWRLDTKTNMYGCGNKQKTDIHGAFLLDEGQDLGGPQWKFIRHLALLRFLRTLRIQNADVPLSAPLLLANKPYLQNLSVTSDQRSVSSSLTRMAPARVMQLYRNIPIKVTQFPKVKVLSLSANSAPDVEGMVAALSPYLEHFSWRVPTPDFQPYRKEKDIYDLTNRVLDNLSWRAPQLETLRLCISMRKRQRGSEMVIQDFGTVTSSLRARLPLFQQLKHLEVHSRGDQGFGGFWRTELIGRLPRNLSRLYISDNIISVKELVKQTRQRFFMYLEDLKIKKGTPFNSQGFSYNEDEDISPTEQDERNAQTCLDELLSCGESRQRDDDIPLVAGMLGFINFEYSYTDADDDRLATSNYFYESDRTKLLRLNGQLLDREHNLHLASNRQYQSDISSGIEPHLASWANPRVGETAVSSEYPDLKDVISQCAQLSSEEQLAVNMHQQEFAECMEPSDDEWDWYFGLECEAEKGFSWEPVAKVDFQTPKSTAVDVEVVESQCCRWACPDYEISPVGSFPLPEIPVNWQDDVCLKK